MLVAVAVSRPPVGRARILARAALGGDLVAKGANVRTVAVAKTARRAMGGR